MVKENKHWLVIVGLFIVPLSGIFSSTNIWGFQFQALMMLICFSMSLALLKFNKFVALFTLVTLFSFPKVLSTSVYIYLSCFAMWGISLIDTKHYKTIIKSVIWLSVLQGVLVVLQSLGIDPLFESLKDSSKDIPYGFSGSPNQSGLFFAVTSPIVYAYAPILLPLHLFALFMAKTTSALIASVIGMIFIARNKKLVIAFLALASVIFFIKFESISKQAVTERFKLYKHSITATAKGKIDLLNNGQVYEVTCNPLLGFGLGTFRAMAPYAQNMWIHKGHKNPVQHRYYHAHSDYIEVFFELGWLGLATLFMIFCHALYRFIRTKKTKILMVVTACLIVQAISALFIFTVHTATSGMLLILFYGLFYGLTRK